MIVTESESSPVKVKGNGQVQASIKDVGTLAAPFPPAPMGDGLLDLVVQIVDQDGIFAVGSSVATLTGETFGGAAVTGTDAVKTAGCN